MTKRHLKEKSIKLRVEERMSLPEIVKITGASRGSVHSWISPYPLTKEELRERRSAANKKKAGTSKWERVESKFHKMKRSGLSSSQKAKIAESAVLFRLSLLGFEVYGSVFDGDKFDWVVRANDSLLRLQVRLSKQGKHGAPIFSLRCSSGRGKSRSYDSSEFDFLIGYDLFEDLAYVFSWEECSSRSHYISASLEASENWDKLTH